MFMMYNTIFTIRRVGYDYAEIATPAERYNSIHRVPLNTSETIAFAPAKPRVPPVAPGSAPLESRNKPDTAMEPAAVD